MKNGKKFSTKLVFFQVSTKMDLTIFTSTPASFCEYVMCALFDINCCVHQRCIKAGPCLMSNPKLFPWCLRLKDCSLDFNTSGTLQVISLGSHIYNQTTQLVLSILSPERKIRKLSWRVGMLKDGSLFKQNEMRPVVCLFVKLSGFSGKCSEELNLCCSGFNVT